MSDETTATDEPVSTEQSNDGPQAVEELPQWAQDKLTKANREAAKYRNEKKSAAEAAREEASNEFASKVSELEGTTETLTAERDNAVLEHTKLQTALEVGIPGESAADFADLLKGSTEEEVKSHAEKIKHLFDTSKPARAVDSSQGLSSPQSNPQNNFGDFLMSKMSKG